MDTRLDTFGRTSDWEDTRVHYGKLRFTVWLIIALMLSGLLLPLTASADESGLLNGQILYVACNGDVTDQSGQNNPVENNGEGFFVSDRAGKTKRACFFNGLNYLRIPKSSTFNLSNFTLSAWVKIEGVYNGEARAIVSNYDKRSGSAAGTYQHYGIGMAANGPASTFYDAGSGIGGAKDVGGSLVTNEWHLVTAVFKGGVNVELYVDGTSKRKSTEAMPASFSPTGDLFIGRGGNSELMEKRWVGSLDDIRIFNRALSAEDVARLSGVVDLPTGETFVPIGIGETDSYLLEVKEGPLTSVMVTPNPSGGVALNRVPAGGLRDGDTNLPPETSTLILNSGEITYLDEAKPGVVATMNLAGDLEVTDENIPDLKLILPRLEDRFTFLLRSDPSIKVKVNHDGTLEIIDENQPYLSTLRDNNGNYTIIDSKNNTVTLADRNGDAILSHPDAPGIVATFNIFDKEGKYSLVNTETNECVEVTSGLRGFWSDLKKDTLAAIRGGIASAVGEFVKDATKKLLTKIASAFSATKLATSAVAAGGSIAKWWTCLAPMAKFAIIGGAIAAVAIVAGAIYMYKQIKQLRAEVQYLKAVVEQQAIEIANIKQVIAEQQKKINEQAEKIAALEDQVAKQAEEIAKQKAMNEALQQRIADLERRLRAAGIAVDQIPPGEPTLPTSVTGTAGTAGTSGTAGSGTAGTAGTAGTSGTAGTASLSVGLAAAAGGTVSLRKASGLRKDAVPACIVPEFSMVNLRQFAASSCKGSAVEIRWDTRAEWGNAGFDLYRAQKDANGEFINITKVNDAVISTKGNGVGLNKYSYIDPAGKGYYYGLESIDTDGNTFRFENRIVKEEECLPDHDVLNKLSAKPANDSIFLEWEMQAERDSAIFHLWRAKAPANGQCTSTSVEDYRDVVKLTQRGIFAERSLLQSHTYSFEDRTVQPQTTYCYGLEAVNDAGKGNFYWGQLATATSK